MPQGKFTPGPWVFVEDAEGLGIPMVYSSATQAMVAITDSDLLFADAPADEQEANARLIAAAPDLLGALEGLLAVVEQDDLPLSDPERIAARAAIVKARWEA